MARLEAEEQAALRPVHERQEAELAETQRRIVEMRNLIARREALAAYLRRVSEETEAERTAIDAAFRRLMEATPETDAAIAGTPSRA